MQRRQVALEWAFEFIGALFDEGNSQKEAIRDLRFPRIIVALFAGAALSVSGYYYNQ